MTCMGGRNQVQVQGLQSRVSYVVHQGGQWAGCNCICIVASAAAYASLHLQA
jgi:hypothetical protein